MSGCLGTKGSLQSAACLMPQLSLKFGEIGTGPSVEGAGAMYTTFPSSMESAQIAEVRTTSLGFHKYWQEHLQIRQLIHLEYFAGFNSKASLGAPCLRAEGYLIFFCRALSIMSTRGAPRLPRRFKAENVRKVGRSAF